MWALRGAVEVIDGSGAVTDCGRQRPGGVFPWILEYAKPGSEIRDPKRDSEIRGRWARLFAKIEGRLPWW